MGWFSGLYRKIIVGSVHVHWSGVSGACSILTVCPRRRHGSGVWGNRYWVTGSRGTACRRDARRPPRDPSKWFRATKESEMAVGDIVPVPGAQFEETLASASPDFLRAMIRGSPSG